MSKKNVEICIILFKNWKWLFEDTDQTPPKHLEYRKMRVMF